MYQEYIGEKTNVLLFEYVKYSSIYHIFVSDIWIITKVILPFSDDYVNQYASSIPKKTDEQSALNRILHETAAWVIG